MQNIGKVLKSIRQKRGLTQAEVANMLNISIRAYSNIEAGITDLNLPKLFQVSEIFRIDLIDLLARSEYGKAYVGLKEQLRKQTALKQLIVARKDEEIYCLQKKLLRFQEEQLKIGDTSPKGGNAKTATII